MKELFTDGVLVDLDIGYWGCQKALQPRDLNLDAREIPDIFSLGKKMLVPKETKAEFRNTEALARYYLQKNSFAFPIARVHFVPLKVLPVVLEELAKLKIDFIQKADTFLQDYQKIREEMLTRYGRYRQALEGFYPQVEELRDKFHFAWHIFQISIPKVHEVSIIEALKVDKRKVVVEEEINRYRQDLKQQFEGFVKDVVISLRREVWEICSSVSDKITKGEVVAPKTLRALHDLIGRFDDLNFVQDDHIATTLENLRRQLPETSKELKDASIQSLVGGALDKVKTAVGNMTDLSTITGRYMRKIRLED